MIIGITGPARSGKDTVAEYLRKEHAFKKLVFSDIIREEAEKRGMPSNDKMVLSFLGTELRKEQGNAVLAKIISEKIKEKQDYVLVGFRSPEEVDYIRNEHPDFALIAITAERPARFKRRSSEDPQEKSEFFQRDEYDMATKGLSKVIRLADYTIQNNGTKEQLHKKIERLLEEVNKWITQP